MTKRDDYFRKFEGVKPGEQRGLSAGEADSLSEKVKVLWASDCMQSAIRASEIGETHTAKEGLKMLEMMDELGMPPSNVELAYCYVKSIPEMMEDADFSIIIAGWGAHKFSGIWPQIRGEVTERDIPVIYAIDPAYSEQSPFLRKIAAEVVSEKDIPVIFSELVNKYARPR